jgi:drug/metabolite transporter (DMT)-like permease
LLITSIIWWKYLFTINKDILRSGLILGLLFTGGFMLQTIGLKYTSVTKSAFITGMAVVFTPFAFKLIIRKKLKMAQIIGVAIAFSGLWLFTRPSIDSINLGDVLTLLSAIFWAFYITYMDVFTKDLTKFENTIQLVILQFAVATPAGLIGHFLFDASNFKFVLSPNLVTAFLYNGILASVFLTIIHTSVQKYSNPVKAALIFSLEPVFASIFAILIINETFAEIEIIGAIILFAGVIISETGDYLFRKILP